MEPIVSQKARIGSCGLSWLEAGSAPVALLLLHGIGSNAAAWAQQILHFRATYRIIAWNAPGYAESAAFPQQDAGPDDYAAALAALLDHLGIARCILLGHSLGAITAARFARRWPERVSQLILSAAAAGYGWKPGETMLPSLQQRLDDITTLGPQGMAERRAARTLSDSAPSAVIAKAIAGMASVSVKGYQDAVHLLAQGALRQDLLELEMPLDVICGTADRTTPLQKVEAETNVPARRRFLPIEGAAHASYLEYSEAFNRAVEAAFS